MTAGDPSHHATGGTSTWGRQHLAEGDSPTRRREAGNASEGHAAEAFGLAIAGDEHGRWVGEPDSRDRDVNLIQNPKPNRVHI